MKDHSLKRYKHQVENTWIVVYVWNVDYWVEVTRVVVCVWNVDHWVERDLDRSICGECGLRGGDYNYRIVV